MRDARFEDEVQWAGLEKSETFEPWSRAVLTRILSSNFSVVAIFYRVMSL